MTRTFLIKTMCLIGFLITALSLPTWAHHSHNAYEITTWEDIEGTVSEVHLINPHSWLYLNVTNENGETAMWSLEAAGPISVFENGVKREDVQPGDKIKARIHLLRDGTNGGLLGYITPMHGDQSRGHGIELEWD